MGLQDRRFSHLGVGLGGWMVSGWTDRGMDGWAFRRKDGWIDR